MAVMQSTFEAMLQRLDREMLNLEHNEFHFEWQKNPAGCVVQLQHEIEMITLHVVQTVLENGGDAALTRSSNENGRCIEQARLYYRFRGMNNTDDDCFCRVLDIHMSGTLTGAVVICSKADFVSRGTPRLRFAEEDPFHPYAMLSQLRFQRPHSLVFYYNPSPLDRKTPPPLAACDTELKRLDAWRKLQTFAMIQ
jgi:hypothetical protein